MIVRYLQYLAVMRIHIRMDPHHIGKLDPDLYPHQSGKLNPDPHQSDKRDPDPHRSEKQDPYPRQSEKEEALEVQFGAMEDPSLEKSEW